MSYSYDQLGIIQEQFIDMCMNYFKNKDCLNHYMKLGFCCKLIQHLAWEDEREREKQENNNAE